MNKGVVIKSIGSSYRVRLENEKTITCGIRGKLRLKGNRGTNPVTVGDYVSLEKTDTDQYIIVKVEPRKNYIIRKATNLSRTHHILAANIDQAVLLATLAYPETTTVFMDRFLVTAEAYRIPPIVVFNKMDLYDDEMLERANLLAFIYKSIGYQTLVVSVKSGKNLDKLEKLLFNKTTLISGHSGVGKSTLLNTLNPELSLKVEEISSHHKSCKHTTTFSEMHTIKNGGYIIDTPGIKAFGIIDIDKNELYHFFPEIFKYSENCKYHNCTHIQEPECAVIEALDEGLISVSRYNSYLNMFFDEDNKYR